MHSLPCFFPPCTCCISLICLFPCRAALEKPGSPYTNQVILLHLGRIYEQQALQVLNTDAAAVRKFADLAENAYHNAYTAYSEYGRFEAAGSGPGTVAEAEAGAELVGPSPFPKGNKHLQVLYDKAKSVLSAIAAGRVSGNSVAGSNKGAAKGEPAWVPWRMSDLTWLSLAKVHMDRGHLFLASACFVEALLLRQRATEQVEAGVPVPPEEGAGAPEASPEAIKAKKEAEDSARVDRLMSRKGTKKGNKGRSLSPPHTPGRGRKDRSRKANAGSARSKSKERQAQNSKANALQLRKARISGLWQAADNASDHKDDTEPGYWLKFGAVPPGLLRAAAKGFDWRQEVHLWLLAARASLRSGYVQFLVGGLPMYFA